MPERPKTFAGIRAMDAKTWMEATIAAKRAKKSVADWVGEAIREKLSHKKGDKC